MKRLIALCLVLILAFSVLPAEVSAKYQYIDYTRIYGGSTSKSYDVDASFGPLSVIGKLRYTGSFTDEEIDEEIRDTLKWMGITEEDIGAAHAAVDLWAEEVKITREDYEEILENWGKMFGQGEKVKVVMKFYDYIVENNINWETILKDAAKDLEAMLSGEAVENDVYEQTKDWFQEQYIFNNLDAFLGESWRDAFNLWKMLYNTAEVSLEQWKKDKQRWADRVAAAEAEAMLKTFYDTVNNYLLARDPKNANWVLSVAGGGVRYFNFFGSTGNKQYYTLVVSAAKDSSASTVYRYRGQGANLPYGTYTGSGAIRLTHDLTPFDTNFWNLPIGQLPAKNWLNDMIAATAITGGGVVDREGGSYIKRTFTADKLTFTVPGGYAYQYSSYIPANPGNRDVTATIGLNQFQDELYTHSDHKLSYKWGLMNVQDDSVTALEYVILDIHSEMDGNNLKVICDNCEAYVNLIGIEFADIKDGDIISANGWDSHIWADMDSGIKLTIHMK